MQYRPGIRYPENEEPKVLLLETLFRDWHQHFATPGSGLDKEVADSMVFDGFCPYYLTQKRQILFIGREARDIGDRNYIDMMYRTYRGTQMIGTKKHLDDSPFHRRMLQIAYGIVNGMVAWQDIPKASEIGRTLGDAHGLSFAFMNISKLPNESETSDKADWPAINAAYALSTRPRNFINEEIAILEPNIVITMNLVDHLEDELESLGKWTSEIYPRQAKGKTKAKAYWLEIAGRRSLVIDTWHFSAYAGKNDEMDFYIPICEAIRCSEAKLAL